MLRPLRPCGKDCETPGGKYKVSPISIWRQFIGYCKVDYLTIRQFQRSTPWRKWSNDLRGAVFTVPNQILQVKKRSHDLETKFRWSSIHQLRAREGYSTKNLLVCINKSPTTPSCCVCFCHRLYCHRRPFHKEKPPGYRKF